MDLNRENYFSAEASRHYMSNSQYKSFLECEARTMAEIEGVWGKLETDALLTGSYVHAWLEGRLEEFRDENPQLYKKDGEMYAKYQIAEVVIERMERDKLFMAALSGNHEVILTAEMFGAPWKILIDCDDEPKRRFGDLKVLKSLSDKFWNPSLGERGMYENVFEYRGYNTGAGIYAEIERLSRKRPEGDYAEPFIAVVTKEKYPDLAVVSFVSDVESVADFVESELCMVKAKMPRILQVKSGEVTPNRCESCDYCKNTKVLTGTSHYTAFRLS